METDLFHLARALRRAAGEPQPAMDAPIEQPEIDRLVVKAVLVENTRRNLPIEVFESWRERCYESGLSLAAEQA